MVYRIIPHIKASAFHTTGETKMNSNLTKTMLERKLQPFWSEDLTNNNYYVVPSTHCPHLKLTFT